jgi:hypothetical protein
VGRTASPYQGVTKQDSQDRLFSHRITFREKKHGIFDKMLPELKHDTLDIEDSDNKLERAF